MAEEGMEDPQPIKVMLHKPLKHCLNNLQFVLPIGGTPRPALRPLRPSSSKHQEWCLHWVPNVEPLTVPPSIGVIGGVRGVGDRRLWPLLQGPSQVEVLQL